MNEQDFDSSDSSDEEYVPSDGEAVSEEENSGEEDDLELLKKDAEENGATIDCKKGKKRKAKPTTFVRKRKGGIMLDEEKTNTQEELKEDTYNKELATSIQQEQEAKKVDEEKKKADNLWSDFMKDVGSPKSKPKPVASSSLASLSKPIATHTKASTSVSNIFKVAEKKDHLSNNKSEKVTITQQFDFAGETVTVTKEVDAQSKEAKQEIQKTEGASKTKFTGPALFKPGVKKPGGLGSILGKIATKPKMGTLEKSKLDWDSFKKDEGIEEELQIHNRGKEGYVERKNFLQRTDVRQFEIEKSLRLSNSKR